MPPKTQKLSLTQTPRKRLCIADEIKAEDPNPPRPSISPPQLKASEPASPRPSIPPASHSTATPDITLAAPPVTTSAEARHLAAHYKKLEITLRRKEHAELKLDMEYGYTINDAGETKWWFLGACKDYVMARPMDVGGMREGGAVHAVVFDEWARMSGVDRGVFGDSFEVFFSVMGR